MTTILLTFTNVSWNKGSAAQVSTFVSEVRKLTTDIRFVLLSHSPELDRLPASILGITLVGLPAGSTESFRRRSIRLLVRQLQLIFWALARRVGLTVHWLANDPIARAYAEASLIADFSGDSYRDWPGGVSFAHNVNLIAARTLRKPVVLISQSIGPFRWYGRWLSRRALNSVALIYIRERHTAAILNDLKVTSRIVLAPDIAFVLPQRSRRALRDMYENEGLSAADSSDTVVGISTSHLMCRLHEQRMGYDYVRSMVRIIEYLHETYDATILLIPHEIKSGRDDRVVSQALADALGRPAWLKVINGDYDASQLKTLISTLDMLLAARLHAGIAGLSSSVPTVLLSWSHKYAGVLEDIGLSQYVWDGNRQSIGELERLCDDVMAQRQSIARILTRYSALSHERIRAPLLTALDVANHTPSSSTGISCGIGSHAQAHSPEAVT